MGIQCVSFHQTLAKADMLLLQSRYISACHLLEARYFKFIYPAKGRLLVDSKCFILPPVWHCASAAAFSASGFHSCIVISVHCWHEGRAHRYVHLVIMFASLCPCAPSSSSSMFRKIEHIAKASMAVLQEFHCVISWNACKLARSIVRATWAFFTPYATLHTGSIPLARGCTCYRSLCRWRFFMCWSYFSFQDVSYRQGIYKCLQLCGLASISEGSYMCTVFASLPFVLHMQ